MGWPVGRNTPLLAGSRCNPLAWLCSSGMHRSPENALPITIRGVGIPNALCLFRMVDVQSFVEQDRHETRVEELGSI